MTFFSSSSWLWPKVWESPASHAGTTIIPSHARNARLTASGCSIVERCPQPGTISSRAPGIPLAISRDNSTGVSASSRPTTTSVGQRMPAEDRAVVGAAHDGSLLALECLGARVLAHLQDRLDQRLVGEPVLVDQHAAAAAPAPCARLRARQARSTPGAARCAPASRRARRCRAAPAASRAPAPAASISTAMKPPIDSPARANRSGASARIELAMLAHGVVAGVIGDGHVGDVRKCRQLGLPQGPGAQQARHQHEALSHRQSPPNSSYPTIQHARPTCPATSRTCRPTVTKPS